MAGSTSLCHSSLWAAPGRDNWPRIDTVFSRNADGFFCLRIMVIDAAVLVDIQVPHQWQIKTFRNDPAGLDRSLHQAAEQVNHAGFDRAAGRIAAGADITGQAVIQELRRIGQLALSKFSDQRVGHTALARLRASPQSVVFRLTVTNEVYAHKITVKNRPLLYTLLKKGYRFLRIYYFKCTHLILSS